MNETSKSKLLLALSAVFLGTVGVIRRYVVFSSEYIAAARGIIGTLFLALYMILTGKKVSFGKIKEKLPLLLVSGVLISANWMLLFESYRYGSIITTTLCSYMAPMFVIIVSTVFFKEKIVLKKALCIAVALIGILPVSGLFDRGAEFNGTSEAKGAILALCAAAVYAAVLLINKRLTDIDACERTVFQLGTSAAVMIPYILIVKNVGELDLSREYLTSAPVVLSIVLTAVLGIIHTGLTYTMYFSSLKNLSSQTIAILCYIDPIVAIALSAVLLGERPGTLKIAGAVLVLGATLVSELDFGNKKTEA